MVDQSVETPGLSPEIAEQVLAMELFQGLPPGARRLLVRFGRIANYRAKTEFVQQGEFTSDFHVVLDGLVTAYRTEQDGRVRRLAELTNDSWFGELSALSNQPSPARLKADLDSTLLTLEAGLFKDLYKAGREFRKRIDEHYREASLELHLAVVPAFASLATADLRRLRGVARFIKFEEGDEIAAEGRPVDAVYLVRSGSVTFHRKVAGVEPGEVGSERLDGYLMTNSSFGENGLWEREPTWDGSHRALTDAELLLLPIDAIQREFGDTPQVLEGLRNAAEQVTRADRGTQGGLHEDEVHGMVHRGSVKGGEALVIDLEKCVRCNACVESCVAVHEDRVPRLSKTGFRVDPAANKLAKPIALVTSCYHCETPGCMMSCSYGAIRRDPQGLIRFIGDNCVGCAMCVKACPYDVIRLTEPPGAVDHQPGFLASLPFIGAWFGASEPAPPATAGPATPVGQGFHKEVEVQGRAVKCDRCEGLPFEACVYNCPCGAIERRKPADLFGSAGPGSEGAF